MFEKLATRRDPALATHAGAVVDAKPGKRIRPNGSGWAFTEMGIGAGMMVAALVAGWCMAAWLMGAPPHLAAAGEEECTASCSLAAPALERSHAVLSDEWRWGTGKYEFDEIYGRSETPAAYSYDFVYPRPLTVYTVK